MMLFVLGTSISKAQSPYSKLRKGENYYTEDNNYIFEGDGFVTTLSLDYKENAFFTHVKSYKVEKGSEPGTLIYSGVCYAKDGKRLQAVMFTSDETETFGMCTFIEEGKEVDVDRIVDLTLELYEYRSRN